jgi:hypothetical protein
MMPFEVSLKGEQETLQEHLAYGMLMDQYRGALEFGNEAAAAALQDHHWRLMASWMTNKWASDLSKLDGVVHLALSCLAPLPKLIMVSNFTSANQADHAFMGTGTIAEMYDGMACSDGGAESGRQMTPLFQDKARGQVIVNLMRTGGGGYPWRYNISRYSGLITRGQDDAVLFLRTGESAKIREAITYCPTTADTTKNVCCPGPFCSSR